LGKAYTYLRMLCRSVFRSSSLLLQTRNVPAFVLSCAQLRRLPSTTVCPARGFAQFGGGKGGGGGGGGGGKSGGGPPAKKPTANTSVKCEFEGAFHTIEVPTASFFEDAPDMIAEKLGEEIESLSFEIKTKSGEWMDLDDAPEEEKHRAKVEMKATRQEGDEEGENAYGSTTEDEGGMGARNEDAMMAVEDLANAAVSEGKVKKGGALNAEQARAWVIQHAEANEDVRTFILNTVGGFEHLVQSLQFPFTYNPCFDEAPGAEAAQ